MRQPAHEADGVGDEVAPSLMVEAARGALLLERAQPVLQDRDATSRQPAIGLELRLAGAARADARAHRTCATAEALEVLPHAPHARQVVLELRELDLELPLGAHGV